MRKKQQRPKYISRFVYWTPRLFSIAFILFLALFSLDVFDGNYGFWGTLLALFMHNIPSLILTILLVIAWKHEMVGAVTFFLGGLLYIGNMVFNALTNPAEWYMLSYSMIIAGPAFFIGALFLAGWLKRRKHK